MTFRVIDNKKIDLTESEWSQYNKIVKANTTLTNNGADLFSDLFETNKDGIIIFLKAPSKKCTTLQVFLFLIAVFNQQHMRQLYKEVDDMRDQIKNKLSEFDQMKQDLSLIKEKLEIQ